MCHTHPPDSLSWPWKGRGAIGMGMSERDDRSLMPEGLLDAMDLVDLVNLMRFLEEGD